MSEMIFKDKIHSLKIPGSVLYDLLDSFQY